ncbi:disease resistance protein RUN1-like [Rhododendron vialii]|uniref:disease resistance protein RUN1-like n=1 Tax=Rhododendron vialii TaxID=182163 RepID=UPI00265FB1E3|nr:disease resistance protein RUN1-like [Rhododendron vialii]XP_058200245.1 disease resistance protein RUN1-like [Rhododendron vialii]
MDTAWANEASSSSLPSSIATPFKYDVFLSFSDKDTRENFTSHLLAALERHGFHTFIDDKELNRGEYIGYELLKAIEESRISLVVLSKNYAASRWCLDELVKIMECRKTLRQIVLPIFYNVEPSDVRAQKGSLADAFAKHEEPLKEGSGGRVEKWRKALTEVANLSGWDLPKVANGDEAHLIRKAVEEVQNKLDIVLLHVACHEIGLGSRLKKLKKLLKLETDDVRIVAICGMGGIGKTTIAKKLYNLVQHKFEGSSFLANIRETSKQPNGLIFLQEQLLSDILRSGTHNLRNCHQGIEVIKRRAFCHKVLLILDDVDDVQQLKDLAIDRDSFGSGSRIIITTRDVSSLNLLKVDEIYAAEELNEDESLELFRGHCFKEEHPTEDHLDLSGQVVHYAGGLPLALEVLGSFFCGKSIPQWKNEMAKLRKIPDDNIQGKLKISFDSLSKEVKELFLDMACFFVGTDRNFTVKILESCNSFAEIGIQVLADRCLIKYHPTRIVMHDLLRDMGREIVRQESVKDPGRRSRLWYHEDALGVLGDGTGTESVGGLFLNFHELNEVQVNSKAFEKMDRLWLLHLNYVHLKEGYEHISKRLLWLCWNGFPLKCLPSKLHMENLVTLDLRYSSLKKAWNGSKILVKLKFLYLSYCYHLIETPDFSGLNNLEELLLNDCIRLVEVDESIRFLNKLLILDMKNCKKLRKYPSSIWTLKSLESLDVSGCSMLRNFSGFKGSPSKPQSSFLSSWIFRTKRMDSIGLSPALGLSCLKDLRMENCNLSCLPNEVGNLISLETLDLSANNLPTLPDSICDLTRLKRLTLEGCNLSHLPCEIGRLIFLEGLSLAGNSLLTLPDGICNLACLKFLNLNDCNLSHLPDGIGILSSLEILYLERNNVCSLPNSFSDLASLLKLQLNDCGRLQSLPQLPVNLKELDASYCTSLESIPTEFNWRAGLLMSFLGCNMLAKNNVMERIDQSFWEDKKNRGPGGYATIYLPGDEIPNWFQYQYAGSKLSVVVPPRRILGWSLCIVVRTHGNRGQHNQILIIRDKFTELDQLLTFTRYQGQDQMILLYYPSDYIERDELEIEIIPEDSEETEPWLTVKKCGINFIYEDNTEMSIKKKRKITDTRDPDISSPRN